MWDACGAGYITFNANEVVKPDENETEVNMAFIIENSVILSAMAQRMQELRSNVHVRYSSRIKDIQFPNEKVMPVKQFSPFWYVYSELLKLLKLF